jgi:hypothetical protein
VRIRPILPLALALVVLDPSLRSGQACAQNSPQMSPAAAIPQWRTFVGANPLGIPFDIVAIEAETAIAAAATVGLVGSYNDIDNRNYKTLDGRFKYWPAETAMRGFAVGLSAGWTNFRGPEMCTTSACTAFARQTLNAGTIGVLVDYNWTQGPSQRFVVGTGVGAKRVLSSRAERDRVGLDRAYVTGRFVIGLLF